MTSLLQTIYNNTPDLVDEVQSFIVRGEDLNAITEYCESALRVASNNGRFDVIQVLLEAGADSSQLDWSPTFYQVAYGDLESISKSLHDNHDLERRPSPGRTRHRYLSYRGQAIQRRHG